MSRPRRSAGPPARLSDGSQLPAGSLRPPVTLSSSSPSSEALGALPESVHPSAVNIAAGDSPVAGSQRRSGQGGRGGARRSRAPERSAALAASGDASAAVQHSQQRRRSPSPTSARSSQSSLPPRSPPPNLAGQVSPRAAGGEGSLQALASSYSSPVGNHLIAVNEVNLESQHVSVSATSHRPWLHSSSGDSIPQINIIPPLMPQGWIRGRVRPHMAHNVSFQPMLSSQLHTPSPPQVGPPIQYNFISPIQAANVPLQRLPYSDSINVGGHPSALVQSGSFQQSPNTTLSPWARPAVAQVEAPHGNLPPWSLPYPPPNPDRVQRPMQNWMAPYPPPYVSSYGHASNASITNIPVPDLNSSPFGFGSSQDLARPPAPGFSFGTPVPIESLNSISGVRVNQSFVSEVANIHSVSVTAVSGGGAAAPLPEVITVTGSSALQTEPAGDSASREETSTQALALPGTSAQSVGRVGMIELAESSLAQSTRRAYQSAWSQWEAFLQSRAPSTSGQAEEILEFMWERYNTGVKKAAMASALAGISFMAKLHSKVDPTRGFIISKAMKGWARTRPSVPDSRRPITVPLLRQLIMSLAEVTSSSYESTLFSTAFSMAFHGAFRISELVAKSRVSLGTALLGKYTLVASTQVSIKIARSKTDQFSRGHWVTLSPCNDTSICPVAWCNKFSGIRPKDSEAWLAHMDGSPLSKFQFNAIFKSAVIKVGLDPKFYGTHSFRIGAATAAAMGGASVPDIKLLGRWKSDNYKRYIRP
ncbi:uncharacterized protein LOC142139068 isoform X2 [Mixophyes fleayi]|uniref:uncharacterized protein LOC142139068 isoform X2 n=1 Tax=Mixophyes fleayi TaxID=3061075 RepID=UPI003F4E3EB9